jgi:NADH-quinone oxidoreductase subunit L
MTVEFSALMAILIPFAGAAFIPLLNLFASRAVPAFAVIAGLACAVFSLFLPAGITADPSPAFNWLPGVLKTGLSLDALSVVPALIAACIGFLVLLYSLGYMKKEENLAFYYSTTLLFIGSMIGMALSDNFLALFFFWEVMGVCSYLLIGFFYHDPKSAYAGVKAFMTTKIGDIGLIAAILILYAFTGTFNLKENILSASKLAMPLLSFISVGFIMGAAGKSAQVPLQVWLPDAMEAPTTISALIHAATMVNAGVYLLARVFSILALVPGALPTVQWIGAITALLGSLLAVFNNDLKRILAYSTISQLGYMVFAVGVGGVFASQFHLFSHAIFKALLFLCAGAVIHEMGTRDVREMGGLQKNMPVTGTAFLVGALALMGLPVLNGFFSKDLILEEALKHQVWIPLVLLIFSAILTAFYSMRMTAKVFWGNNKVTKHVEEAPPAMTVPLVLLAIGAVFSWFFVGRITSAWQNSGLPVDVLSWRELFMKTFFSHSFLITAAVLIIGFILFLSRSKIGSFINNKMPGLVKTMSAGLGFDIFYGWIIKLIYGFGNFIRCFWEEVIMEGINKLTGTISNGLSVLSRRMQTGDVRWNLFYVVLTLIVLLGVIIW